MKFFAALALCLATFASVFAQERQLQTREQYIARYSRLAVLERDLYGIPASITMAQGMLESDNGNSRLATEANNHFGIKCKKEWTGPIISHDDDARGECFRKYEHAEASYRDHSEFLFTSPRYAALFKLKPTDYQGWAYGLKAAGYATNPTYAPQLIKIIEDNKLYLLDAEQEVEVLPTDSALLVTAEEMEWTEWKDDDPTKVDVDNYVVSLRSAGGYQLYSNNGSQFIVSRPGDTFESIASKVRVPAARLRKYNDVAPVSGLTEGRMVYLKPKAAKAANGQLIHVVESGETLYSIAQRYGVKLKSLARMNQRTIEMEVAPGQQVRLR